MGLAWRHRFVATKPLAAEPDGVGSVRVIAAAYGLAAVPIVFLGLSLPDEEWRSFERFYFFSSSLLLAIAAAFVASLTIRLRTGQVPPFFVGLFCAGCVLAGLQALGCFGFLLGTLILFVPAVAALVLPPLIVHVFVAREAWRCSTVTDDRLEFSRFVFGLAVPFVLLWLCLSA